MHFTHPAREFSLASIFHFRVTLYSQTLRHNKYTVGSRKLWSVFITINCNGSINKIEENWENPTFFNTAFFPKMLEMLFFDYASKEHLMLSFRTHNNTILYKKINQFLLTNFIQRKRFKRYQQINLLIQLLICYIWTKRSTVQGRYFYKLPVVQAMK